MTSSPFQLKTASRIVSILAAHARTLEPADALAAKEFTEQFEAWRRALMDKAQAARERATQISKKSAECP